MTIPTVHLNGTAKADLLAPIVRASGAMREALEALQRMAPNARDYYVQGPAAFRHATDEHAQRYAQIRSVRTELEALYEAIDTQGR